MSHTPAPWIWVDGYLYPEAQWLAYKAFIDSPETPDKWLRDDQPDRPEAIVETDSGAYGPRGDDALLIASAPELLAALKSTLDLWGPAGFDECADAHCTCVQQQARAAIAKAEGHTNHG